MKPWDALFLLQSVSVHKDSTHKPNYVVATRQACYMRTNQDIHPDCALSDKYFICHCEGCISIRWEPRSRLTQFSCMYHTEMQSYKSFQARTVLSQLTGPERVMNPSPAPIITDALQTPISTLILCLWVQSIQIAWFSTWESLRPLQNTPRDYRNSIWGNS